VFVGRVADKNEIAGHEGKGNDWGVCRRGGRNGEGTGRCRRKFGKEFLGGIIGEGWELGGEDEGSAKNCFCWGVVGKFMGVYRKERRKKGRCETQSEEAQQAVRVALWRRWVLSIIPLDWGWKAVVGMWEIWRRVVREDQREEVNWEPLSEVRVWGMPKREMWKGKLLRMRMRKWRKGEWLQANSWFYLSL
jgi:hypothetical protein